MDLQSQIYFQPGSGGEGVKSKSIPAVVLEIWVSLMHKSKKLSDLTFRNT